MHFQQRHAGELGIVAVLHEAAARETQLTVRGRRGWQAVRPERAAPSCCEARSRQGTVCSIRAPRSSRRSNLQCEGRERGAMPCGRVPELRSPVHSCADRCMASATCAAVTANRGDRNQAVPRMPSRLGSARRSSSPKCLPMLTVERTSVEGSTHWAELPPAVASRMRMASTHWRIAPPPGRDWHVDETTSSYPASLSGWGGRDCALGAAEGPENPGLSDELKLCLEAYQPLNGVSATGVLGGLRST